MSEAPKRRWFRFSLRAFSFWLVPYAALLAWLRTLNCDQLFYVYIPATILVVAAFIVTNTIAMRKPALIGAGATAVATCISGAGAWLTDLQPFYVLMLPGGLFAFLCLEGDNYHSFHDTLRHAIPASIVINTSVGLLLGGIAGLALGLFRRNPP